MCCGCGTCASICPVSAISMELRADGFYHPALNKTSCITCGKCINTCPMVGYPRFSLKDHFLHCVYGHSPDEKFRSSAASGGLLSEILASLIEAGDIDAALVVKIKPGSTRPEMIIAKTAQDIRNSAKSVYFPIPVNEALREIKAGNMKVAVVGLPCQVQGIRLLQQYEKWAENNIKYVFGLVCNHMPSAKATEYLLYNCGIENPESIEYRGGGWPGYMTFSNLEKTVKLPYRKAVSSGFGQFFRMDACECCQDPFASEADASFSDAYFLQNDPEKMGSGQTFAIIRNDSLALKIAGNPSLSVKSVEYNDAIRRSFQPLRNRKELTGKKHLLLFQLFHPHLLGKVSAKQFLKEVVCSLFLLKFILKTFAGKAIACKKLFWKLAFKMLSKRYGLTIDITYKNKL